MRKTAAEWMNGLVERRETHVWHVRLDDPACDTRALDCLSADELERANRLADPLLRERFLVVRAAVRAVLGRYAGTSPAAVPLAREAGGKPFILLEGAPSFSLTHSGTHAAIAVAAAPVGIDFEHVRALRRARAAERVLHPETLAVVRRMTPPEQELALIDAWTLREAHVKAVGGGMFRTPDVIPFTPHAPSGVQLVRGRDGSAWSVLRWLPQERLRAAVAVHGVVEDVVHFNWEPGARPEER